VLSPRQVVPESSLWGLADEDEWGTFDGKGLFSSDFPDFDFFSRIM
jgi:hypothetical protein